MSEYTAKAFLVGIALLISVTAVSGYAQTMPPGMEEVSGQYVDEEAGINITFPEGWSGLAFGDESGKFVTVAPGGMTGDEEVTQTMVLSAADKEDVEDPSDPSQFTGEEAAPDCTTPTFNQRTVSGVTGWEGIVQCTDDEGKTIKMKMVAAETATRWIMVLYWATLTEFDSGVGAFDSSVNTLTVQGAVNSQTSPGGAMDGGMKSSMMAVMVGGSEIEVSVQSSSVISAFKLEEASKMLSFKADGSGTSTVVAIGKVLEGPYTVMVDGQATQDFELKDEGGVETMTVSHASGAHEVTITGTQVVPEFPIAAIGVMVALIGIAAVIGRTRLIRRSS